jgi:nickel superoxide dismutase
MTNKLLKAIDKIFSVKEVQAHCDIPCGIYDPSTAQISALTVIRMIDLMNENKDVADKLEFQNKMSRYIAEKERHAEMVKHEIRIIWGDFFKAPQFEQFPELHELTHSIMLLGSKARQGVSKDDALALLEKVNRFAEIFWEIKGVKTKKAVCPYAPSQEVVYPQL